MIHGTFPGGGDTRGTTTLNPEITNLADYDSAMNARTVRLELA